MGLTVKIKNKDFTIYAYSGWEGVFINNDNKEQVDRNTNTLKKTAELFKEAPAGWLKKDEYTSPKLEFSNIGTSTIEDEKKHLITGAMITGEVIDGETQWMEEQIALPDGRNAWMLFYVAVGFNYFNFGCQVLIESESDKKRLNVCSFFIDGVAAPNFTKEEAIAWKDYFKKMLLTLRENQ